VKLYGIKGIEVVMYTQGKLLGEIMPLGIDVGSSQNVEVADDVEGDVDDVEGDVGDDAGDESKQ